MRLGLIAIGLLVGFTGMLQATSVLPADVGELSHDAVAIVVGRVAAVDARWTEERRGIETLVTLDVETYLKGGLGESVQFVTPGGDLGRFQNVVVGAPRFVTGERVVVFLGARGPSIPFILGFNQGVFRVKAGDRAELVTPPAILPTAPAGRIIRGDPSRRPMPLAEFERSIRELVGGRP
jgi:hypothetical protein